MNQKTYCPECGTKMVYAGKMPNFCTNCGFALSSAAKSRNVGHAGETGETGVIDTEEEQSEESYDYQGLAGLDVEIIPEQETSTSLGDLVETLPPGSQPVKPLKGKRTIQQEFEKEAGAIRPSSQKER